LVIYYHTSRYIFAVANGYIASIQEVDGSECPVSLVGAKLLGGLNDRLEPLSASQLGRGCRLKFDMGSVCFITDHVVDVETVASLSIPPSPPLDSAVPPESFRIRDPVPTVPEILNWGEKPKPK
jgi:hypothetical protein